MVDDSRDGVALLLRAFKQAGVANPVEICNNADEAIAYLQTHQLPALMLLDLHMPEKDGFYVLSRLKTEPAFRELKIIVLTASSNLADINRAYDMGANSFLTKPLDFDEFREMVSAFKEYWLVRKPKD
jgi:CheY-like chemotaxis protein